MALPSQANLCRQHHSSDPLQSEGGSPGTGCVIIRERKELLREGDKVTMSQQKPPLLLRVVPMIYLEMRSGLDLDGSPAWQRGKWFRPAVGCPLQALT